MSIIFNLIATELDAYADLMADRLVGLGGVALGTARTAARQSTLPEYPGNIAAGNAHALNGVSDASHPTGTPECDLREFS